MLVIGALIVLSWWWDRRSKTRFGHCQKCGYNLTGNVSGVCPECGEKASVQ
jgi:rubrerythrin